MTVRHPIRRAVVEDLDLLTVGLDGVVSEATFSQFDKEGKGRELGPGVPVEIPGGG